MEVTGVLYLLLLELDEMRARVRDDGHPFSAGLREGLDLASAVVRDLLASSTGV